MGASGKWMKALVLKKSAKTDQEKVRKSGKKWKSYRGSASLVVDSTAVVRAQLKDSKAVRQELAAIRIQTACRGFLARRELRALKGVVRIQALVRGRKVRKQVAEALRCMQNLLRLKARIVNTATGY